MSGANNVGPRIPSNNVVGADRNIDSSKPVGNSFSEVLGRVSNDPKSSFVGLGKVLQSGQLSATEREVACQSVITQVLGPNSPYHSLTKDQSFMEAVRGVIAEDPRLSSMIERQNFRRS